MRGDTPVILEATDVRKTVPTEDGALTILSGIDLAIEAGETVALVGASGSGKSTLLGLLAGLDVPTSGRIVLAGRDLGALDEEGRARARAEHVGFVFQNFQLLDSLTALENVMLPLELRGDADAAAVARRHLEAVGLAHRATHLPRKLSGGEQQRVAVARAFASHPRVLFADEPTGNLDRATGARVADLLFALNAEAGTTLVLVSHDPVLAARCDRALEIRDGHLVPEPGPGASRGPGRPDAGTGIGTPSP